MSFCDGLLNKDCDICYEFTYDECEDIIIDTDNLVSGAPYYAHIVGQFDQLYTQDITVGIGGTVTLERAGLPDGLFTKSQGKFYFYLSTEETPGTQDVTVTISSIDYTCLIVELI
jgi:hypothetical protein